MIKYFLCRIIGDGTPENSYRPSMIQYIERKGIVKKSKYRAKKEEFKYDILRKKIKIPDKDVLKWLLENGYYEFDKIMQKEFTYQDLKYPYSWSAIYYPKETPYEICLVRIDFKNENQIVDMEDIIKEIISDKDWKEIEKYGFTKNRWVE